MTAELDEVTPAPAAAVEHVSVTYRTAGESVLALDDVTVTIAHAATTALTGPSGSGKSTLLRLFGLFEQPSVGSIRIGAATVESLGRAARRRLRRRSIAFVHQRPLANLVSDLRVEEHIIFVRQVRGLPGVDPSGALAPFDLGHLARAWPAQLSGGEQQRLAFAMAVASEPHLILADEPTAELDRVHALDVTLTISRLQQTGVTTIVASHDATLVAAANQVITLCDGRPVDQ
jgi:ABC-type lipoprotein export system ATPase subunit